MFRIRTAFDKAGSQLTLQTITQKLSQKNLQKPSKNTKKKTLSIDKKKTKQRGERKDDRFVGRVEIVLLVNTQRANQIAQFIDDSLFTIRVE